MSHHFRKVFEAALYQLLSTWCGRQLFWSPQGPGWIPLHAKNAKTLSAAGCCRLYLRSLHSYWHSDLCIICEPLVSPQRSLWICMEETQKFGATAPPFSSLIMVPMYSPNSEFVYAVGTGCRVFVWQLIYWAQPASCRNKTLLFLKTK